MQFRGIVFFSASAGACDWEWDSQAGAQIPESPSCRKQGTGLPGNEAAAAYLIYFQGHAILSSTPFARL